MIRSLAIFFICISFSVFAQDRALNSVEIELQRLIQDQAFKHGQVGFVAVNLDNGKVIAEHNSFRSMIPASIQKIVTTAASLDKFGPAHTFETRITHTGEIKEGTLYGNLVIYGGGDPTLSSRFFPESGADEAIIKAIMEKGIKKIEGEIVFDLSFYTKHPTPDAMAWEDMGNYFGASPSAFTWQDNMLKVDLRSGQPGKPVVLASPWPINSPYSLDIDITAADNNKDDAWFFSAPGSKMIYGKGTIPARHERFTVKISNPDPVASFAQALIKRMKWDGATWSIRHTPVDFEQEVEIISISSPKLSELIRVTNYESVNLFAEALNLANDTSGLYRSVEGGSEQAYAYLKKLKVNSNGMRILDGSGVSPMNRINSQGMVDLLSAIYRSNNYEFFKASLPVGGESGTVKWYFKSGKAKGNLRAKSGTMRGVRNYAGYVANKYDENIAFCIMMNDYDETRRAEVMRKVENLIEAVIVD